MTDQPFKFSLPHNNLTIGYVIGQNDNKIARWFCMLKIQMLNVWRFSRRLETKESYLRIKPYSNHIVMLYLLYIITICMIVYTVTCMNVYTGNFCSVELHLNDTREFS